MMKILLTSIFSRKLQNVNTAKHLAVFAVKTNTIFK